MTTGQLARTWERLRTDADAAGHIIGFESPHVVGLFAGGVRFGAAIPATLPQTDTAIVRKGEARTHLSNFLHEITHEAHDWLFFCEAPEDAALIFGALCGCAGKRMVT